MKVHNYLLRNIPGNLLHDAQEFAKERGTSFRGLIFEALRYFMKTHKEVK